MTVILLTCIFNSMQKIPRNAFHWRNWHNSRCSFDNHTHTLCHFISMQMISTSTISTFAFWRAILKIINRKLTELKLLLVFKPISLVSIETVSHDILTRLGFWFGWVKRGKTHGLLCCAQLLSSLFKTKTKRNMSLIRRL